MRALRVIVAVAVAAFVATGLLVATVTGEQPSDVAAAADTRQFDPGNIITDQLFFNGAAMSAGEIQTFLNVRNPTCVAGSDGTPCLKNYRQSTWTRAATNLCPNTYIGAANESAATIIDKVGRACGISQRVLLVILQKEQGLVSATGRGLYPTRYRAAMGMGCPDTAACDAQYYGFFNQVYSGAAQYKRYAVYPEKYGHRAGRTINVRYDVELSCGSSPVFIRNQATAGLYNYTPYQPNAASLAAGKGTGDGCSAYGNRNFWIYFTDWFGSTHTAGAGDLADLYVATGAENGPLGAVIQGVTCGLRNGGCRQGYVNGSIYWSPTTGARAMLGAINTLWKATGAEQGTLGYPTKSSSWLADGVGQYATFEKGSIYWSPTTGARAMLGEIETLYKATGAETGTLGYPTKSSSWLADGVGQYATFQKGSIYWSPTTGARAMLGGIETLYKATGAETGTLGYPTKSSSWLADGVGQYATFQKGSIYWSPTTGARAMLGEIETLYKATGAETGALGYPTKSVTWLPDGVGQYATFEDASIYWSPDTGARALLGPIEQAWQARGAETGPLGYPTWSVSTAADGVAQYAHFEGGSLWSDGATVVEFGSEVRDAWTAEGAERGPLGAPTADEAPMSDGRGRAATFEHGTVYWTPETGAHAVWDPIRTAWLGGGPAPGQLGYPTETVAPTEDKIGQVGQFEDGSIYWSPTTGAHALTGEVQSFWVALGAGSGLLGYPTSDAAEAVDGVGRYGTFENGSIYWSPATGTRAILWEIDEFWQAGGAEAGPLGYPTWSVSWLPDKVGLYARFEHGSVYWSPDTGAHALSGGVETLWKATGAERGALGYPTGSVTPLPDGIGEYATFEKGSIYWSPTTGARAMLGGVETLWKATGAEQGPLGYPTWSVSWLPDKVGQYARFQKGSIYWSPSTGARAMLGEVETFWKAIGAERGPLGYPTWSVSWLPDGVGQYARFQKGSIYWSPTTGTRAMLGSIETLWKGSGAERGLLGYPTKSVSWLPDRVGQYATFEKGSIYWSPKTGTRAMLGAIETRWKAVGAERGVLGYPTQSVSWLPDQVGHYAAFQSGSIYWSPSSGARIVRGAFLTAWKGAGAQAGRLGYPVSDAYAVNGGSWQDFQHGRISYSNAAGRATVLYR